MNVEIGTEDAAQFPEKEYINGIFLAVHEKWPAFASVKMSCQRPSKMFY
jgi:hypothetical protein